MSSDRVAHLAKEEWAKQGCSLRIKTEAVYIVILWQKYMGLEYNEYTDGEQRSGLCCRSGLRSYYGHF